MKFKYKIKHPYDEQFQYIESHVPLHEGEKISHSLNDYKIIGVSHLGSWNSDYTGCELLPIIDILKLNK